MWGGGHVKGFDSEAPSNLNVHACTLSTRFRKSSPEAVESYPQGCVVNTDLTSNQHPCRAPSLSCSLLT